MKENKILALSFEFAWAIIAYCEELETSRKFVLANQLLKAGTSIGANVREAQNSESKADFIHKTKIAAKEADETEYWLELCKHAENYPDPGILLTQILVIRKILSAIIGTTKRRLMS